METIKLRNDGRLVYHFPVTTDEDTPQGKIAVERYRVVLGDSKDAQLTKDDPDKPGKTKKVPNVARVPEDALASGWEPTKTSIYLPAPTVIMTIEQFAMEVFPAGSTSRGVLDHLVGEGTVQFEESKAGALERFERKLSQQMAAEPASTEA